MIIKMSSVFLGRFFWVLQAAGWVWAASAWDKTALQVMEGPLRQVFPAGYEVVADPKLDATVVTQMPPGDAIVAAYVEEDGRRYYMTDWSYNRYRQGMGYNWIRELGGSVTGPSRTRGSVVLYRIAGLPAGETLNIRSGPGTNFAVVTELATGAAGIEVTGGPVQNGASEWVPIAFSGDKGWTRSKYLTRDSVQKVEPDADAGPMSSASMPASSSSIPAPAPAQAKGQTRVARITSERLDLVFRVELPEAWMDKIFTSEMLATMPMNEAQRERVKACVLQGVPSENEFFTLQSHPEFNGEHPPTETEIEASFLKEVQYGEGSVNLKKEKVTFLGRPAYALQVDLKESAAGASCRFVSIVALETTKKRYFQLIFMFDPKTSLLGMGLQDLADSVKRIIPGTTPTQAAENAPKMAAEDRPAADGPSKADANDEGDVGKVDEDAVLHSPKHGLTVEVILPVDLHVEMMIDGYRRDVVEKTKDGEVRDIVFSYNSQELRVNLLLERIPLLSAEAKESVAEIKTKLKEGEFTGGVNGSPKKGRVTFLGEPGIAIQRKLGLFDQTHHVTVMTLEPVKGEYYQMILQYGSSSPFAEWDLGSFADCMILREE